MSPVAVSAYTLKKFEIDNKVQNIANMRSPLRDLAIVQPSSKNLNLIFKNIS